MCAPICVTICNTQALCGTIASWDLLRVGISHYRESASFPHWFTKDRVRIDLSTAMGGGLCLELDVAGGFRVPWDVPQAYTSSPSSRFHITDSACTNRDLCLCCFVPARRPDTLPYNNATPRSLALSKRNPRAAASCACVSRCARLASTAMHGAQVMLDQMQERLSAPI